MQSIPEEHQRTVSLQMQYAQAVWDAAGSVIGFVCCYCEADEISACLTAPCDKSVEALPAMLGSGQGVMCEN